MPKSYITNNHFQGNVRDTLGLKCVFPILQGNTGANKAWNYLKEQFTNKCWLCHYLLTPMPIKRNTKICHPHKEEGGQNVLWHTIQHRITKKDFSVRYACICVFHHNVIINQSQYIVQSIADWQRAQAASVPLSHMANSVSLGLSDSWILLTLQGEGRSEQQGERPGPWAD